MERRIRIARYINWLAFGLLLIVLFVGGSLLGGLVWLRTEWGGEFVRGQIEKHVGGLMHGEVRLGGVSGDIVSGIVLEDFALIGEDGVALVDVERLTVEYPLMPFFDKRIVLSRVRLERAEFNVVRDAEGGWNFRTLFRARPPRPPDAPPSWGSFIDIDRIEFIDTDVRVDPGGDRWPMFRWDENEFLDLNGVLDLRLVTASRGGPERRFEFDELAVRTTTPEIDLRSLDGKALWTDTGIELDAIEIETAGSRIEAEGVMGSTGEAVFEVAFDSPRIDLAEVQEFVPAVRIEGMASARGRLLGPPSNPNVEIDEARVDTGRSIVDVTGTLRDLADIRLSPLDLELQALHPSDIAPYWDGYPFAESLSGRVRLDGPPRQMQVDADLRSAAGGLAVEGTVGVGRGPLRYNVSATTAELNLGVLIGRPGVEVVLTGGYVIEGTGTGPDELDARLVAGLGPSRVFWWDLMEGETSGRLLGRMYLADSLTVRLANGAVSGRGQFGLAADGVMHAEVDVNTSRLEEVWPTLSAVRGAAVASATLDGTYRSFDVVADVEGSDLEIGGVTADRYEGEVTLEDVGGAMTMRSEGRIAGLRAAGIFSDTGEVDVTYGDRTMQLAGVLHSFDESRTVLSGEVSFADEPTTFTLTSLAHTSPSGNWVMAPSSRLVVGGPSVRFESFEMVGGVQRIRADGELPLDDGEAALDIELADFELAEFARLSRRPSGDWTGRLTAIGRIEGPRAAPTIEVDGTVTGGRIFDLRFHRITGRMAYGERIADVDVTVTTPTEGHDVVLTGRVPIDLSLTAVADRLPNRPVDFDIRGVNTDLSLLQAFIPGIADADGPIDLTVEVTGTSQEPEFEGVATLRGGRFQIPATGVRYRDIVGRIAFNNDEVRMEELRGTDGRGGIFRMSGMMAMENLRLGELDLELVLERLRVVDQRRQSVLASGSVAIGGTTLGPQMTGTVTIDEAVYRLPERTKKRVIDLDEATLYVEVPGLEEAARDRSPSLWTRTSLDLVVEVSNNAILTSDNARVEIDGDLSLFKGVGTGVPTFSGTLSVRRGFYREFGQRFTIQTGEVFFFGTPDLNPGLHIVAARTIPNVTNFGDVEIRIIIGGRLRTPTIDLASTPEFERSEIVSLALFGTPNPSTAESQQLQQAIGGAALQFSGIFQAALAREIGLDVVEVSQREEETGDTATLVRVGKFVTPDVYVTVEQEVGGREDRQEVGVRYQVSQPFSLQATAGTEQTALDLFWEFSY